MDKFEDRSNPCPCPQPVIELLQLAVDYAQATNAKDGAGYVKTFMEQPSEVWCGYINLREENGTETTSEESTS